MAHLSHSRRGARQRRKARRGLDDGLLTWMYRATDRAGGAHTYTLRWSPDEPPPVIAYFTNTPPDRYLVTVDGDEVVIEPALLEE